MKQQENSVQLKSPNPLQVEEEHVSKTDRKEAQKEQKRVGQAVAKTNEEIEMEQKERGNGDITMEVKEGGTERDVNEYYFEDPSNIGIVACSYTCAMQIFFTYKSLHLFLKCLVTMPSQ